MRAIGALEPEDHIHNLPDGPSRAIDSISRGLVSFRIPTTIMTNLEHRIYLRTKISATRGLLVSAARTHVVSLYTLNIATQLTCKVQVASLLHEDSWMGTWTARGDGSPKIVAWYTRRELPSLTFAHFFASQQHLGRQAHLAKYWEI